jgi:DnaJ family protein C protein 8
MEDDGMDSLFSEFMNQVTNIKSNKMKKLEEKAGSPEEVVERLTATKYDPKQGFGSAFGILQVSPEASESEITKAYRKLSVLIHPDKCKLEKAADAFMVLKQAYQDTKDPNYNDSYKDILPEAKARVRKEREAENKAREKRGEDPLDMEGNDFDQAVLRECEKMTTTTAEQVEQKNEVLAANMRRQQEMINEAKQRKRELEQEKKKFERHKDKRAAGWQVFMNNIESKKLKTDAFHKIGRVGAGNYHHRPEERRAIDGKGEIDLEDEKVWRSDVQAGHTGIDLGYKKQWR